MVNQAERHDRVWDVAIIGAGPAGAAAAMELAKSGRDVLLIDKHDFPRDKVCGDALIPDALRALEALGLYGAVQKRAYHTNKLTVFSPSRIEVELEGEFFIIRREVLDAMLVARATTCGARFRKGEVTDIELESYGVSLAIRGDVEPIRAKFAMLATGANVTLPLKAGLISRRQPSAAALRCYVRSATEIDRLIISYDRSILPGYAWIFPLGDREYNVGCGVFYGARTKKPVNLREAFNQFTTQVSIARDLMQHAEHVTPVRGATIRAGLTGGHACNGTAPVVSLGECVGTTYPFTGEGIGKALETGMIGAECVHQSLEVGNLEPLREFSARIERELAPRYVGYEIAQNWLARSWVADLVARRVQRSQKMRRIANGVLQETVDPRRIFSWKLFIPGWLSSIPPA